MANKPSENIRRLKRSEFRQCVWRTSLVGVGVAEIPAEELEGTLYVSGLDGSIFFNGEFNGCG